MDRWFKKSVRGVAASALGDVRWNRNGCASKLGGQAESLVGRE
jgi:hypothetical protein